MDRLKIALLLASVAAFGLSVVGAGCDEADGDGDGDADADDQPACEHDLFNGPDSAGELAADPSGLEYVGTGFVCPIEDRDWYRLVVPEGHHLLTVGLSIRGPLSPVEPTYAVYQCDPSCVAAPPVDGPASCCTARAAPLPAEVDEAVFTGTELEVTHCLEPGEYFLVVRDQGDDRQDGNRPRGMYTVTYSTQPDPDTAEPNDGPETAVGLAQRDSTTWAAEGQITCRGDQDWYVLDASTGIVVGETDLLDVRLEVAPAAFQPQVRVIGPAELAVGTMTNAASGPTDLSDRFWLPSGGRYYIVVEDDDGAQADPGVTYHLTVRVFEDPDPNEPNNDPSEATALGTLSCGLTWSYTRPPDVTGYLSALNDVDVYLVNLDPNCGAGGGGILDVDVSFGGGRPEGLEPSVRVIRRHPETPCTAHSGCRRINLVCETDVEEDPDGFDCAGFGNSCLPEGHCAGASMCLPGGSCGATVIERHPDFCGSDGHCHGPSGAMENRECATHEDCGQQGRVHTAIPLGRNPDPRVVSALDSVWVVVQEFRANASSLEVPYTLRVSARADPDTNEPNESYSHILTRDSGERNIDGIPTLDWGDCATGYISYERDVDYFRIAHPCPADAVGCDVHISYDVREGPVDLLAGNGYWDVLDARRVDLERQPARVGSIGGPGDCEPANPRTRNPSLLGVRDVDIVRDFSTEQRYQICLVSHVPCGGYGCAPGYDGTCWYP